ncbi:MAG: Holliday junction branch migration protein RuvA [Clostridiales bacterium]|nr:Holliday junction branch migration protein RuvA [Clostridiales bacterium]
MYSYIKGTLVKRTDDLIVVENNGIGYEIICPFLMSSELGSCGEDVVIYLYQSVKEDDISLFGFTSQEQKDMFLLLITVSSVGPKSAMSVCSQIKPDKLALAVMNGDVKELTNVKGLGKKTAERIILELRDKLKKTASGSKTSAAAVITSNPEDAGVFEDAVNALMVLGYKEEDSRQAVSSSYTEGISLQELIKNSLKKMVR